MRRFILWFLLSIAALLVLIQFVPVAGQKSNPSVVLEPPWDSPGTRHLAERACFDCHSNETKWPWYSSIAPASWLVIYDVKQGREELNFSEWHREQDEAKDVVEVLRGGSMPPRAYLLTHAEARLTSQEVQALASGLQRSLRVGPTRDD